MEFGASSLGSCVPSTDGHLEKNMSIFLIIKCKQRFFGSSSTNFVSPLAMAHSDVRETGLKRALNLIIMSLYR